MKRSPLKPKRDRPRRAEGRVTHQRMKPAAKANPTAEEASHMKLVATLGCLVCGRPANIHHVMHYAHKMRRRDHRYIVPLCRDHHQGNSGVHGLGSEKAFQDFWGIDLVAWAIEAWAREDAPQDPFWTDGVTSCRALARRMLERHKSGGGERPEGRTTGRSTRLDQRSDKEQKTCG